MATVYEKCGSVDTIRDDKREEAASSTCSKDENDIASTKSLVPKSTTSGLSARRPILLDDVLSQIPLGQFHWRLLILVCSGYFAVCSEMMLFIFLSSPVKKEWGLEPYDFPWLPFSSGIFGICGGYVAGIISDKFGRRLPFLVGMLIIALFGVISAVAPSFPVFIILRSLVTAGNGTYEAVGFVLLVECLPRKRRGTILVVVTLFGALGAVFAGGFAWLILPRWGWRWFVAVCAVPAFGVLLFEPFAFYESPRHLLIKGKVLEAKRVLMEMARLNKCPVPDLDGLECISDDTKSRGDLRKLFSKDLRWKTLVFSTLWILQATGYWGVTTYLPEYMDRLGVDAYVNTFSIFIGEIPGLLLAMFLIEKKRCGRNGCLRMFAAMTALSLLIFAFIPKHIFKSVLIVLCYFSMVPNYSILNTFTPETYPTSLRSTAMAWMNILIEFPGLITPFIGASLLSSNLPWLYPVVWGSIFILQFLVTFAVHFDTVGQNLTESSENRTDTENERDCSISSMMIDDNQTEVLA